MNHHHFINHRPTRPASVVTLAAMLMLVALSVIGQCPDYFLQLLR